MDVCISLHCSCFRPETGESAPVSAVGPMSVQVVDSAEIPAGAEEQAQDVSAADTVDSSPDAGEAEAPAGEQTEDEVEETAPPAPRVIFVVGTKGSGVAEHCQLVVDSVDDVSTFTTSSVGKLAEALAKQEALAAAAAAAAAGEADGAEPQDETAAAAAEAAPSSTDDSAASNDDGVESKTNAEGEGEGEGEGAKAVPAQSPFIQNLLKVVNSRAVCLVQVEQGAIGDILDWVKAEVCCVPTVPSNYGPPALFSCPPPGCNIVGFLRLVSVGCSSSRD